MARVQTINSFLSSFRGLSLVLIFCLLCIGKLQAEEKIQYTVYYIGLDDPKALKMVKAVSDLTLLKKKEPLSINALRYRAESDIPEMVAALRACGYLEATISIQIDPSESSADIFVLMNPGPCYTVSAFVLSPVKEFYEPYFSPQSLGVSIGKSVITQEVLSSEAKVLTLCSEHGYPLARIDKSEYLADPETKTVAIHLDIARGPLCFFGPSQVEGLLKVRPEFLQEKILWKPGEIYSSTLIEKTQNDLIASGLFSTVFIVKDPKRDELDTSIPIKIEVIEAKNKSINLGVSYQTFFGPGVSFGWEHRNLDGLGRKFSLQADATRHSHSGSATLSLPNCFGPNQDDTFSAVAAYESIYTYTDRTYTLTNRFEKRINNAYLFSASLLLDRLFVHKSVLNKNYTLLQAPLYFRWSNASDLLNPTHGSTLEYRMTPSVNLVKASNLYLGQMFGFFFYLPMIKSQKLVLAQQICFESIVSKNLSDIPVPKRVLGGSDQELRGYRYKSVSPLSGDLPTGGRSGIFYSLELRSTLGKHFGLVPFIDFGSIGWSVVPKLWEKWYKSAGIGLRYFSFLGPLRLDIAFPLNRRESIDPRYRVLLSLGQAF